MLINTEIKQIVEVSEDNNLRSLSLTNDALILVDEIKEQFNQLFLQARVHSNIYNGIENQIRILKEKRERSEWDNIDLWRKPNFKKGPSDDEILSRINLPWINYLWLGLFNVKDDYVYDFGSDDIYEIEFELEQEGNYKIKQVWWNSEEAILMWEDLIFLKQWTTNIYLDPFAWWVIDLERINTNEHKYYILLWKDLLEIEKEYDSW